MEISLIRNYSFQVLQKQFSVYMPVCIAENLRTTLSGNNSALCLNFSSCSSSSSSYSSSSPHLPPPLKINMHSEIVWCSLCEKLNFAQYCYSVLHLRVNQHFQVVGVSISAMVCLCLSYGISYSTSVCTLFSIVYYQMICT